MADDQTVTERKVYVWNDLSPMDGCSLVRFTMSAQSLGKVAHAVRRLPTAQHTTVGKLVTAGRARTARGDEAAAGLKHPGVLLWLDDPQANPHWRPA
jgi:hypothetical protein